MLGAASSVIGTVRSIEHRHRQRRLLAAAAAVVLLLSAGTVAWVARSGGEDVTAGGVQEEVVVSCASGAPTFPIGALATLGDAPPPDEAMTAALRTFLSTEEGQSWPQAGWRVLTVDDSRAVLVAEAGSTVAFQTLEREGGAWDWAGSSQPDDGCPLKVVPPDGHNLVEWRLDPDGRAPGPTSTEIDLLVHEVACASGRPIGDRLVGPELSAGRDHVQIGFLAEAQGGDVSCPGNPEAPVTVELGEALGPRDLSDLYSLGQTLADHL